MYRKLIAEADEGSCQSPELELVENEAGRVEECERVEKFKGYTGGCYDAQCDVCSGYRGHLEVRVEQTHDVCRKKIK